ncbi:ABC transporter substrate-binding protein [Paenibacillus sp. PK3_47]|uniref:extracellular solute-binding protein n=1 Tax=Paenibacillus sp. PK3_47 TaxID=2072642 RepID=UPI00201D5536|nr:extracellular solute-binding protein [Paenibacillus sp. PK3_47]UQZ37591.1 ABC transporter substrate-binding protein [Paenibacillus sp. PK3_47]
MDRRTSPGDLSVTQKNEPAFSSYSPPVELSMVREFSDDDDLFDFLPGETLEDNRWTRLYEEELGIKITYDWIADGEVYYKKFGMALASGRIPDVVKVNAQQLRQLSNAGLIQDLSEVYEQNASSFTRETLGEEGSGPFEAATIDGKLMGIPQTASSIEGAQYLWIRTDWLERLGLEPPSTMDELLQLSKAFTEGDPDGNGMDDTYGLAATSYLWDPVAGLANFMAGYGAYPSLWLKDPGGRLVYGGVQPQVKTALASLQKLYAGGQMDPEFSLQDGAKVKKIVGAGKIGIVYGEQWASFWLQLSREQNPQAQWRAYPIVSAAGSKAKVPLPFATNQFFAVKKEYEHPEALVKMFNLYLKTNWGEAADYKTYYSNPYAVWGLSPVTPAPGRKNLNAFYQLEHGRRTGDYSGLSDEAESIKRMIDIYQRGGEDKESGWGWERIYGQEGVFSVLDQYIQNDQLLYESFVGSPTETMLEKNSLLINMQLDTYMDIILGSPLDEFDRFTEEWERFGGTALTTEVNRWYEGQSRKSE